MVISVAEDPPFDVANVGKRRDSGSESRILDRSC